jgi:hypothetical protein
MTSTLCCLRIRFGVLLALLAGAGCSSSVTLTQEPMAKLPFTGTQARVTAKLGDVRGAGCLRDEIMRYLSMSDGVELAASAEAANLTLSGKVTRIEVHSNRGDEEAAIAYFTAFVITAPIAVVM